MKIDVKKSEKELYNPKKEPSIINVPPMWYIVVKGKGNPNEEEGEYKKALEKLYIVAFTIKMDKKQVFDYVVPPLEGFWYQEGVVGVDNSNKESFCWYSVIRLPIEITQEEFNSYLNICEKKKNLDFANVKLVKVDEGLCVQCMHIGAFDSETSTINMMEDYLSQNGYVFDYTDNRLHHEIYLSDPRRCKVENWKTIIRLPIRKS